METKEAHEIIDNLWLGSQESSQEFQWLKSAGITHILAVGHLLPIYYPTSFHYLVLQVISCVFNYY